MYLARNAAGGGEPVSHERRGAERSLGGEDIDCDVAPGVLDGGGGVPQPQGERELLRQPKPPQRVM